MALHSSWRELPRPDKATCPKLFFNFSPDKDCFSLRLTDLVAIWECSSDRIGILSTAKSQRTSIDPGESGTQLRVLLEKLQQSLEAGKNHLFQAQDSSPEKLFLETNLDLPKPLKPLTWTFELEPKDASELAEQLLRPCLHEASVAKQKLDSLLNIIKDKDHVLSRLLEKIESSQIDLSLIFPGITGLRSRRGSVTVKEAQKHIPGIAAFDLDKWVNGFDNSSPYAGFDEKGMHNLVTGCEKCPKHTTEQHNSWLKKLDVRRFDANSESFESTTSLKRKASEVEEESSLSDTESDFERQPTPPHLKKSGNAGSSSKQPKNHGSSSSNANSDAESHRPSKRARLGRLGGPSTNKKVSQPSLNNSSSPVESAAASLIRVVRKGDSDRMPANSDTETATATASESEHDNPATRTTPPPPSGPKEKEKRKLGRLNSRSSRATSSSTAIDETNSDGDNRTKTPTLKSETPSPHKTKASQLRDYRPLTSSPLSSPHRNSSRPNPTDTSSNDHRERDTKSGSAAPPTPSRRLGRLSRQTTSMSQFHSRSHSRTHSRSRSPSHSPSPNKRSSRPENATMAAQNSDTDTETETETASASDTGSDPDQNDDSDGGTGERKPMSRPASSSTSTPAPVPEPEPKLQETAEQAANRRREELKQRLHGNNIAGARKKRKF